jgi:methionyl aminopeptidase
MVSECNFMKSVYHKADRNSGPKMQAGMIFTIEPMINAGKYATKLDADKWTVRTKDGSLSAQWEHTILVTDN